MKKGLTIFKNPLFTGSAVMVGGNMIVNAVNYVYHLVMGRILGPLDYGVLASIFSILYIVSIVPLSTSFAIVKFVSDSKNDEERYAVYKNIKSFIYKIAIIGGILIFGLSPIIASFLRIGKISTVLFIGPIFALSLVVLVEQAAMQGVLKFSGVVVPNFVSATSKLLLGIIFVYFGFSVTGAIGAVFLGALFAYFGAKILSKGIFRKSGSESFKLSNFLRYAFPVLFQALAFTSIFTVDLILAKHFLPAFEAGLYAALSTLGKIIYFATQPIAATMFPIVSGRRSRGEKYKHIFLTALLLTFLGALIINLFYFLYPEIAIRLLYGSKYLAATKELVWMGAFIGIYGMASVIINFFLSIGRTKVVIAPVLAAVMQIIGLTIWHQSILQIIQVSLVVTVALFTSVALYLLLSWSKRNYSL